MDIDQNNMFELKDVKAARLWMLPPAAMEVAIELLWEDKLAHPQWPHVFVVPRFMTHMWRRDLGKNADILFTVPAGVPFWGGTQFEPLIVAIIFPLAHVSGYTGPWAVKGTDMGTYYKHALGEGFKRPQKGSGPQWPQSNKRSLRLSHPRKRGPRTITCHAVVNYCRNTVIPEYSCYLRLFFAVIMVTVPP